jgi:hypothetical protein
MYIPEYFGILILIDNQLIIGRRALLNREKSRFCTPFVSLVSHPLTRLSPSDLETFTKEEIPEPLIAEWDQFATRRREEFMAMSIWLIPWSQIEAILEMDFRALLELVNRNYVRLDTSGLDEGDETVVYSEEETDRYIDCWRKVAVKFSICSS